MTIIVNYGYLLLTYLKAASASSIKESILKSEFSSILWYPWPLKSNATKVPNCLTYFARQAKLQDESPAPCMQKKRGPLVPAIKIAAPF